MTPHAQDGLAWLGLARSSPCGHPPLQSPTRWRRAVPWVPRGAPSPIWVPRSRLWRRSGASPKGADPTAFGRSGDEPDQATKDLGPLFRKILDLPSTSSLRKAAQLGPLGIGTARHPCVSWGWHGWLWVALHTLEERPCRSEPSERPKHVDRCRRVRKPPGPSADLDGSLQLQISNIANDNFIGRLGIGRIRSGVIRRAQQVRLRASAPPRLPTPPHLHASVPPCLCRWG